MASNFGGTPVQRVAEYKRKGLDFFMAKPALEADVRGSLMDVANRTDTSTAGIWEGDVPLATKMTEHLSKSKEKSIDALLNNDAVTDGMVSKIIKDFDAAADAQKKFVVMKQNKQRIDNFKGQIDNMKLSSSDPNRTAYLDQVYNKSIQDFGGSYNNGIEQTFSATDAPGFVDIPTEFRKDLQIAMSEMTPEEQAGIGDIINSIELVSEDVGGGKTANFLAYDKSKIKNTNTKAIDGVLGRLNDRIKDPNSNESKFLNFLPDQGKGITSSLADIAKVYHKTKMTENTAVLQNLGMTGPGAAPKPGTTVKSANVGVESEGNAFYRHKTTPFEYNSDKYDIGNYATVDKETGKAVTDKKRVLSDYNTDSKAIFGQTGITYQGLNEIINGPTLGDGNGNIVGSTDYRNMVSANPGFVSWIQAHPEVARGQLKAMKEAGIDNLALSEEEITEYENLNEGFSLMETDNSFTAKRDILIEFAEGMGEWSKEAVSSKVLRTNRLDLTEEVVNDSGKGTKTIDRTEEFNEDYLNNQSNYFTFGIDSDNNMVRNEGATDGQSTAEALAEHHKITQRIKDAKIKPKVTSDIPNNLITEDMKGHSSYVVWELPQDENNPDPILVVAPFKANGKSRSFLQDPLDATLVVKDSKTGKDYGSTLGKVVDDIKPGDDIEVNLGTQEYPRYVRINSTPSGIQVYDDLKGTQSPMFKTDNGLEFRVRNVGQLREKLINLQTGVMLDIAKFESEE